MAGNGCILLTFNHLLFSPAKLVEAGPKTNFPSGNFGKEIANGVPEDIPEASEKD
jgi:hypothetical protein